MTKSKEEEIVGSIWILAGICALGFGFTAWGWILITKGAMDEICAIGFALVESTKKGTDVQKLKREK